MTSHHRRDFLKTAAVAASTSMLTRPGFASESHSSLGKAEHCIYVWLGGGAGHTDTFDPKRLGDPKERKPGSYYPAIDTAIPGVQVCEHMPKCAAIYDRFVPVRSVHHDVVDEHAAATNRMHTGRLTSGTIVYPSIGSGISHVRGPAGDGVPAYVVIGYPNVTRGPGFLGAAANYVYLTDTKKGPAGLSRPSDIADRRWDRREKLLDTLRAEYRRRHPDDSLVADYDQTVGEALRLGGPEFAKVFDLDGESADLRNSYGGEFGQRCLLSRRLIQSGVRFIEVSHNLNFVNGTGWDVHREGILNQHELIRELDTALSALVLDLERHQLLDKTLIVVGTEFGRPPGFDAGGGRGHQSEAFSVLMAGGGLQTGQAIGTTDELAKNIVDRPVSVPDLHATMYAALGIDPEHELYDGDRPVPITDGGKAIAELFG
ncbi:DUF1501 domain-containing protein [Stratiformator vulcanicus]|uniref:Sulfatase n=1 Tax=Stratiformator vulcanicus TaxID=2527980 RepID=A0A517R5E2_9PLAN|nr:DUF1501 domain-containing protein [Stratiformator vulcanicus]QDT39070.1 hypothetical protein Pan189_34720 [Stratiformator vulcanicus]